ILCLSTELAEKNAQLSGFSSRLPTLSSLFLKSAEKPKVPCDDTVLWDPSSACLRPPLRSRVPTPLPSATFSEKLFAITPDSPPVECPPGETSNRSPSTLSPQPLFPPTIAILGDSIIRNVRFFNAITKCFPGSTVTSILHELPQLLVSLPSTIIHIIDHVGFNDTSLQQSEVTKVHFKNLVDKLRGSEKAVFISGPLPSFARGVGRFSRLLSLNTWLQSASALNGFSFIDNFNLFWNRSSFYKSDGVHPSRLGSSVLAQNIQHAVQTKTTPTPM
uniref:SGNH hydrolase-type esterase domain-containing protein n=1 Tax=Sphaeramia orbicularis TaxID=375764 RepID=A0A673AEB6_9TELE